MLVWLIFLQILLHQSLLPSVYWTLKIFLKGYCSYFWYFLGKNCFGTENLWRKIILSHGTKIVKSKFFSVPGFLSLSHLMLKCSTLPVFKSVFCITLQNTDCLHGLTSANVDWHELATRYFHETSKEPTEPSLPTLTYICLSHCFLLNLWASQMILTWQCASQIRLT